MQAKVIAGWCKAIIEVAGLRSLAAVLAFLASPALAQDWPSGTVRIIVPYAARSPVDFRARPLIDRLTAQTKGVFILENQPGAGGSVGLRAVVQAPPGGHLLLTTSSVTMVPTIYPGSAFHPLRDLTSISMVTEVLISGVRAITQFAISPTSWPRRKRRQAITPSAPAASVPAITLPARC